MASPQLSIIIPTYNERENVALVLQLIDETCSKAEIDYEVIFVDDASPDGTQEAVQQMQQLFSPRKVVLQTRPGKLGLGTAYRHGLQYAKADWVILMDADLSHDPKYIPTFFRVQQQTGADIVTGTRYAPGGGITGWNWRRKLTSRGANFLAATLLRLRVSDLTGAFRLYKRPVLEKLLGVVASKGYAFQMEMIARASAMGTSIAEVPIVFVDRVHGQSKLGASEYTEFICSLIRLFFPARAGTPADRAAQPADASHGQQAASSSTCPPSGAAHVKHCGSSRAAAAIASNDALVSGATLLSETQPQVLLPFVLDREMIDSAAAPRAARSTVKAALLLCCCVVEVMPERRLLHDERGATELTEIEKMGVGEAVPR